MIDTLSNKPITEASLSGGHTFEIIFAQAGHIGPCAIPEIAKQKQYGIMEFINPDMNIAVDAIARHTDIKTAGDEKVASRRPAPNI